MIGTARPVRRVRRDLQGHTFPVHRRSRLPEVQVFGDHPLLQGQRRLDQARDSGSRLEVSDVGLHRADQERAVRIAALAVGRRRCFQFDRVAHLRTRPVRFEIIDFTGADSGARERLLDHPFLRRAVGHRQPRTRAVLIDGRPANHAPDAVAVRFRLREPLEHHDSAALAPHVSVRGGVERRAPPVGREHPGIRAQFDQPS